MTDKKSVSSSAVGIVAMACCFPEKILPISEICLQEGIDPDFILENELDIGQVRVFEGEWRSDPAVAAAKECLSRAGLKPTDIDVIVDFSVLPQDYVVPAWSMSNKIQYDIGAEHAFNIGFGGGGVTNLLAAFKFVSALIKADDGVRTALLIASDVSIPRNRVINPDQPMTILGDGASALIVSDSADVLEILETEISSDSSRHDVFNIPGGGLAHPDRIDLYRVKIDPLKYSVSSSFDALKQLSRKAADLAGISLDEVNHFIGPNISGKDQSRFAELFHLSDADPFGKNRRQYGHVQATDLVINLSDFLEMQAGRKREFGLVCSHGWGHSSGAMLIK